MMNEDWLLDLRSDVIGVHYLKIDQIQCFDLTTVLTVELTLSEHTRPELIEVKINEVIDLQNYATFEEVEDIVQKTIGSRWVITQKELHDGQKTKFKWMLLARGILES